jgi:molybdopterin-containing oxidoreductase family membrane subunit
LNNRTQPKVIVFDLGKVLVDFDYSIAARKIAQGCKIQLEELNRFEGPYAVFYWCLILCNITVPQLLWIPAVRRNAIFLFALAMVINVGMWMERVLIVVQSLHRDFMPSAWGIYIPTLWDWVILLGTLSCFAWLFLVFLRLLPAISISEMRQLVRESAEEARA